MTKMEQEVLGYLKKLDFNNPTIKTAKMFIELCKKIGWCVGLDLIEPHEIFHIRMIMMQHNQFQFNTTHLPIKIK